MATAKTIVFLVNVDYFFISHRLPLAQEALKRGYQVWVFGQDTGVMHKIQEHGIQTRHLPIGRGRGNGLNDVLVLMQLAYYYLKLKPHIVHHITVKPVIYGTLVSGLFNRKAKVVNAVTGLGYAFISEKRAATKHITISLLKIATFFKPRNTTFIFQNEDDKCLYINEGITNEKETTIIAGAGVDEFYFTKQDKEIKEDSPVVITFLARMLIDKGVREFMQAAIQLKDALQGKAIFQMIGGLDLDNPAALKENEIQPFLIPDYLIWSGHRSDIKEIYNQTDIACLPSYREGIPKSLIEAMAMSCAIITTNAPGCRSCVNEGENGFLVPVGDVDLLAKRIEQLVHDHPLRTSMGLASREKMLKSMSLSKVIEQTFALYES